MVGFWASENMWVLSFLLIVSAEVLGGAIFPLDVLPAGITQFLQFTPFPYLIYYPIQLLLGKTTFFTNFTNSDRLPCVALHTLSLRTTCLA